MINYELIITMFVRVEPGHEHLQIFGSPIYLTRHVPDARTDLPALDGEVCDQEGREGKQMLGNNSQEVLPSHVTTSYSAKATEPEHDTCEDMSVSSESLREDVSDPQSERMDGTFDEAGGQNENFGVEGMEGKSNEDFRSKSSSSGGGREMETRNESAHWRPVINLKEGFFQARLNRRDMNVEAPREVDKKRRKRSRERKKLQRNICVESRGLGQVESGVWGCEKDMTAEEKVKKWLNNHQGNRSPRSSEHQPRQSQMRQTRRKASEGRVRRKQIFQCLMARYFYNQMPLEVRLELEKKLSLRKDVLMPKPKVALANSSPLKDRQDVASNTEDEDDEQRREAVQEGTETKSAGSCQSQTLATESTVKFCQNLSSELSDELSDSWKEENADELGESMDSSTCPEHLSPMGDRKNEREENPKAFYFPRAAGNRFPLEWSFPVLADDTAAPREPQQGGKPTVGGHQRSRHPSEEPSAAEKDRDKCGSRALEDVSKKIIYMTCPPLENFTVTFKKRGESEFIPAQSRKVSTVAKKGEMLDDRQPVLTTKPVLPDLRRDNWRIPAILYSERPKSVDEG